jgi:hypothetical protein
MKQCDEPQSIIQGKNKFRKCKEITRISKALTFGEMIAFKTTTLSAQGLLQSTSCADSNGLSNLFFYANGKKCDFHLESVNYLGHIIEPDRLQIDPAKVKVIQDWPEPQKVKDIQSFLGFANFYRQYIHNYSNIVVLLTRLTQKNISWNFDESCKLAF